MTRITPNRFPIAPMDRRMAIPTWICLAVPVVLGWVSLGRHGHQGGVLATVALGVAALYLAIWLWMRPTGFVLGSDSLRIEWPARTWTLPWRRVTHVELLPTATLRARLGTAMRIGVGGLWGGFGLLWTRRLGMLTMYITRCDGLVLLELEGDRPLLLTPEDPEGFVAAVVAAGHCS